MNIGIIFEGSDDVAFLEEIKKKLGEEWKNRIKVSDIRGKILNAADVDKRANMLKNEYCCEKIIALVDTDSSKEEKEKLVKKNPAAVLKKHNIEVAYANICIESWILGCFDIKNPENFRSSQEANKEVQKRENKKTLTQIIKHNEMAHFKKSKSFREFIDKINSGLNLRQNA